MKSALKTLVRTVATRYAQATTREPGVIPALGRLPPFVMGCATIHALRKRRSLWPNRAPFDLLDVALDARCCAFDTAAAYAGGWSERILGQFIRARSARQRVIIVSKGGHPDAAWASRLDARSLAEDLHGSLRRLRTGYIDLYMLHRDDASVPVGPLMESLHRFVQAGKVRALGASNWTHQRIEEANLYAGARGITPFTVSSPHFSLAEMQAPPWPGCISITGAQNAAARAWYAATRMTIIAWAVLGGGYLVGRGKLDEAQTRAFACEANSRRAERAEALSKQRNAPPGHISLAYARGSGLNVIPIIAASTVKRARSLLEADQLRLSPEEVAWLDLQPGAQAPAGVVLAAGGGPPCP